MLPRAKLALLLGTMLATGVSAAIAEMNSKPAFGAGPPGRGGAHFIADYDLNHDGKVAKDEFNRAVGQRFASIAHGQPINAQQFAADAMRIHRERAGQLFRRADWNGDGKLALDEYVAPLRAKFSYGDRNGTGVFDCSRRGRASNAVNNGRNGGKPRRHGQSSRGLCFTSDLNQDGKVTHSEYDTANAKRFSEAAHGAKMLTSDQFASVGGGHFQQVTERIFKYLDVNNDGKLAVAEYAAPKSKQFARLDRNRDGTITRDELSAANRRAGNDHHARPFSAQR